MKARTIEGTSIDEVKIALLDCIENQFIPTLAIVFLPVNQDWQHVRKLLDDQKIQVFGATTNAQFTNEGIHENGIVILLLDLNTKFFVVFVIDIESEHAHETGKSIAKKGLRSIKNPAFILSAVRIEMPFEVIIEGIVEIAGSETMIAGGAAGDSGTFEGTIFSNEKETSKGFIASILDPDKVELDGVAVSGWKLVGTEKTMTECVGSWIYSIDDTSAINVLQKYVGDDIYDDSRGEEIVRLNTAYPLQVKREKGNPIMRPTLLLNVKEKSVLCGGTISDGEQFRFSLPPDFDVIESVVESSKSIKESNMPEAEAVLVFSCVGRMDSLSPMINKELEGLSETWNKPMAGFFSLGEFGCTTGGVPEFNGTTCSRVALKEKWQMTENGSGELAG